MSERAASPLFSRRIVYECIVVIVLAAVLTACVTYPFAWRMWDHVLVLNDDRVYAYILAWGFHALTSHSTRLFDANTFFPESNVLGIGENLLGNQWLFAPAYALTHNPAFAANFITFASFVLCALTMYLVMRWLTGNVWASAVAAFVYAFCSIRMQQMMHGQLLHTYWIPLMVFFLCRFFWCKRWGSAAAFTVYFLWQTLCSLYLGYLAAIIAFSFFAATAICRWRHITPRVVVGLLTAALVSCLVLIPLAEPYMRRTSEGVLTTWLFHTEGAASPIRSYLYSGPSNHLYGWHLLRFRPADFEWEKRLFPGLFPVGLGMLGLGMYLATNAHACRRDPRAVANNETGRPLPAEVVFGAILSIVIAYVLSLGPHLVVSDQVTSIPLPFLWLSKWLPGFKAFRVPARFALAVVFGLALLSGLGFLYLLRFTSRWQLLNRTVGKAGLTAAMIAVLAVECAPAPLRMYRVMTPPDVGPEYVWLAQRPSGSVTLELPVTMVPVGSRTIGDPDEQAGYIFASTYHWQPMVNGTASHLPPTADLTYQLAAQMPSRDAVAALHMLGLKYVILHKSALSKAQLLKWQGTPPPTGLQKVASFATTDIYEVRLPGHALSPHHK